MPSTVLYRFVETRCNVPASPRYMAKSFVAALSACCVALALAQQECADTAEYCPGYPNIIAGSVSVAVTCSQTHMNVTVSNSGGKSIFGGLLEYTCVSSNVSCTSIVRGPVFLRERNSIPISLNPGMRCVVFGCYHVSPSTRMYVLQETWCTVPAAPDSISSLMTLDRTPSSSTELIPSNSAELTPSSSMHLVSADMIATTTVPSPVQSTVVHVPGSSPTLSGVSIATETATPFMSSTSNIILIIIGAMVTILTVLGSVLLLVLIIRKIRHEKTLNNVEWFDTNYRPVKITGLANLSLSLSTLIESLENTREGYNKEHVYKGSPDQLSAQNSPTRIVADMAMEKLLRCSDEWSNSSPPPSSLETDRSPPPSSLETERMHQLLEEQSHSFNASNSNCSQLSSTEPFAKEQVHGDGSICNSNQPSTAVFLESELCFESDLSSYTSEVSHF